MGDGRGDGRVQATAKTIYFSFGRLHFFCFFACIFVGRVCAIDRNVHTRTLVGPSPFLLIGVGRICIARPDGVLVSVDDFRRIAGLVHSASWSRLYLYIYLQVNSARVIKSHRTRIFLS